MIHYHDSNVFDLVVSDITKYLLRAFVKVWIRPKFIYTDPSVQRRKDIFKDGPAILLGRHVAGSDGPYMWSIFARWNVHPMVARDRYYENKLMHWLYTRSGCLEIDRRKVSTSWLKDAVETLQEKKESILIFPEGRFNHEDQILRFHGGAVMIEDITHSPMVVTYTPPRRKWWQRYKLYFSEVFRLDPPGEGEESSDYRKRMSQLLYDKMLRLKELHERS